MGQIVLLLRKSNFETKPTPKVGQMVLLLGKSNFETNPTPKVGQIVLQPIYVDLRFRLAEGQPRIIFFVIFMVKISAYLKYGTHVLNSRANSIYCQQYNNLLPVILKVELWFILAKFQASEIHFSLPKIMIFFL